jgi:hypothetical protein
MKISLYLDEDAQDNDLVHALRLHNVDVVKAWYVGMRERKDEEHLLFAAAQGRVLYSFNVGDYFQLHTEFLTQGRSTQALFWPNNKFIRLENRCAVCSDWRE